MDDVIDRVLVSSFACLDILVLREQGPLREWLVFFNLRGVLVVDEVVDLLVGDGQEGGVEDGAHVNVHSVLQEEGPVVDNRTWGNDVQHELVAFERRVHRDGARLHEAQAVGHRCRRENDLVLLERLVLHVEHQVHHDAGAGLGEVVDPGEHSLVQLLPRRSPRSQPIKSMRLKPSKSPHSLPPNFRPSPHRKFRRSRPMILFI